MADDSRWDEYITWLRLKPHERTALGSPTSKEGWAAAKGISYKTLSRWEKQPAFMALRAEQDAAHLVRVTPGSTVPSAPASTPEPVSDDYEAYLSVKRRITEGALTGDPKFIDAYMRSYGKDFVAEEMVARQSDLSVAELPDVIAEAAVLLAPSVLAAALGTLGWTCTPPNEETP